MKLSLTTKLLHIIIATTMIVMLAVGIYMSETETYSLYPIHKSIGVLVLIFAVYRVFIRIKEGWPKPLETTTSAIQLAVAKVIHWGLITSTVLYPISGMMMSGAGGHGIFVFGVELMASNHDEVSGKVVAVNEAVASLGHNIHGILVWILIATIVLHVAGALKHHFIDKDETIKRMFSFKK